MPVTTGNKSGSISDEDILGWQMKRKNDGSAELIIFYDSGQGKKEMRYTPTAGQEQTDALASMGAVKAAVAAAEGVSVA